MAEAGSSWWDSRPWAAAWANPPQWDGVALYDVLHLLMLFVAAVAFGLALRRSGLRWRDGALYLGLCALGAVGSLVAFDAIGQHAFSAHENQVHGVFLGEIGQFPLTPMEVPTALRLSYLLAGRFSQSMTMFVGAALLLGGLAPGFLGAAVQRLTGRTALGVVAAVLLLLHPTTAYWRVHGYGVAFGHSLFCATLLAAVIAAKAPSRTTFLSWFALGGATAVMRMELGPAVAATAALPLVLTPGSLKHWKQWLPPLWVAALPVAPQLLTHVRISSRIEDFVVAGYLARAHLAMPSLFAPLLHPALVALVLVGVLAARRRDELGLAARALLPLVVVPLFPVVGFIDFGPRHALPTLAAAFGLAAIGAATLVGWGWGLRAVRSAIALGLLSLVGVAEVAAVRELSPRYGQGSNVIPTLPHTPEPTSYRLPADWQQCALYSDHAELCEFARHCHPSKDLRDPGAVGRRWDALGGCVLWTVSAYDYWVTGARHERWLAISHRYPSAPVGIIRGRPHDNSDLHLYRIKERPAVRIEARGASRRPPEEPEEEPLPEPEPEPEPQSEPQPQ